MLSQVLSYSNSGWRGHGDRLGSADLVLYFGDRRHLTSTDALPSLRRLFPGAHVVGCSTGGQIDLGHVVEDGVAAVALRFEHTRVRVHSVDIGSAAASEDCGRLLAAGLAAPDLTAVLVLSEGLAVNGTGLCAGLAGALPAHVIVSGGLAGDGADFARTLVGADDDPRSNRIAGIGFYGAHIDVRTATGGGWDVFGPRRKITAARENVLIELDGEPALDLYMRYLGEEAEALPGSALNFPLRIVDPNDPAKELVRTVLGVDHDARTLTFAGDMPTGWSAQLMRGMAGRLVDGAADAARKATTTQGAVYGDRVALLVSCIGRRLLMGQRIDEEVSAVADTLGPDTRYVGFYSYGEISPLAAGGICELHNQTMTITTLQEFV